jgi:hypothetical protein
VAIILGADHAGACDSWRAVLRRGASGVARAKQAGMVERPRQLSRSRVNYS